MCWKKSNKVSCGKFWHDWERSLWFMRRWYAFSSRRSQGKEASLFMTWGEPHCLLVHFQIIWLFISTLENQYSWPLSERRSDRKDPPKSQLRGMLYREDPLKNTPPTRSSLYSPFHPPTRRKQHNWGLNKTQKIRVTGKFRGKMLRKIFNFIISLHWHQWILHSEWGS